MTAGVLGPMAVGGGYQSRLFKPKHSPTKARHILPKILPCPWAAVPKVGGNPVLCMDLYTNSLSPASSSCQFPSAWCLGRGTVCISDCIKFMCMMAKDFCMMFVFHHGFHVLQGCLNYTTTYNTGSLHSHASSCPTSPSLKV